jgi:uncharacterized protein
MSINEMYINVAQLLKEPIGSSRNYQIDEGVGMEDINSVKGKITLTRTDHGIMVKGDMSANVTGVCSRCLKLIDYRVDYDFAEEFLPSTSIAEDLSSPTQPDNIIIEDSKMLDLSEVICQYALLTIPAKPLCRPDCAGICPSCGHDLNQGSCQCPSQVHDQRWSKLIRLGKESRS